MTRRDSSRNRKIAATVRGRPGGLMMLKRSPFQVQVKGIFLLLLLLLHFLPIQQFQSKGTLSRSSLAGFNDSWPAGVKSTRKLSLCV